MVIQHIGKCKNKMIKNNGLKLMRVLTIKNGILPIFLIFLFIISTIPLTKSNTTQILSYAPQEYILDQYQENGTYETSIHRKVSLAQEFIPSLSPLTKVEVKINKPRKTNSNLVLSLRDSLNGNDITKKSINAVDIPFYTNWLEFDITDVDVTVGKSYFLILSSTVSSDDSYRWKYDYNSESDIYPYGKLYRYFQNSDVWEEVESSDDYIDACFRTYSYISHTDLVCNGFLNWTNIQPAQDNLTGMFTIENHGTPFSKLNWRIINWPSWGTWSFSQINDTNLRPEDGTQIITLNVIAPNFNVPDEYLGKITIINCDDANDTEYIQARLVTPKSKHLDSFSVFEWIQYRFSTLFFLQNQCDIPFFQERSIKYFEPFLLIMRE